MSVGCDFQDVVLMGATLEKLFYEKLAEMPSDVKKKKLIYFEI